MQKNNTIQSNAGKTEKSPIMLLALIAVLVVSTLVMFANYFLRPSIESDLTQKIVASLYMHDLSNAMIKVEGRNATIQGFVSSSAESIKAEKAIQAIPDIHHVENKLLIKK